MEVLIMVIEQTACLMLKDILKNGIKDKYLQTNFQY